MVEVVRDSEERPALAERDHHARLVPEWSDFGPPLRPSPDDTAAVQRVVDGLEAGARVLVLGLTPEIIGCRWPPDTELLAVDHSREMIRSLWPPDRGPLKARVILADWLALPTASKTVDLVVGDGVHAPQAFPRGFDALSREVSRVLRWSGRFVVRIFLRPDRPESVEEIGRATALGRIGSVHALKLRLLAALHGASGAGSCLDDAWRAWKTLPPPPALGKVRGWTHREIVGIESYRGLSTRYFLPTRDEFRHSLKPWLKEVDSAWGSHELAERCPVLVFSQADRPGSREAGILRHT